MNHLKIKNATKKGYLKAYEGDGVDISYPNSKTKRGRVQKGMAPTIQCGGDIGVIIRRGKNLRPVNTMDDGTCRPIKAQYYKTSKANFQYKSTFGATGVENKLKIRKLTPRECWRLMDFDDEDFDRCKAAGVSNTQLYKQAGNSIVVSVLEEIFKEIIKGERKENVD